MPETPPASKPVIYIGPSVWRNMEMMTVASTINLCMFLGSQGYNFHFKPDWGDADIARSRNKVATQFLKSNAEVLLIYDSDIEFKPQDALKLCMAAIEKQSIIGGVFVKRGGDHDPALPLPLNEDIKFMPGEPLYPCEYVSTGFAAVHRSVFEKMAETMPLLHESSPQPFYPFFHHNPGYEEFENATIWMSEDWAMCSNAKALGFQCWLDPSFRLNHWGINDFRLEDMVQGLPNRRRLDPLPLLIGRHWDEENQKKYHKIVLPEAKEGDPWKPPEQSKTLSQPAMDSALSSIHKTISSASPSGKPANGNRASRRRSKNT